MSTTENAPEKQGGCNRIKTVLQREGWVGREHCSKRKTGRETHKDTRRRESLLVVSPGFSSPLITLLSLHRSQSG